MDKACRECLGCNLMELDDWVEPEFCPNSPDPERRERPVQMRMQPASSIAGADSA